MTDPVDKQPDKGWLDNLMDLAEGVVSKTEGFLGSTYLPEDKGGPPDGSPHPWIQEDRKPLPVIDAKSETVDPSSRFHGIANPSYFPNVSVSEFIERAGRVRAYDYALAILNRIRELSGE